MWPLVQTKQGLMVWARWHSAVTQPNPDFALVHVVSWDPNAATSLRMAVVWSAKITALLLLRGRQRCVSFVFRSREAGTRAPAGPHTTLRWDARWDREGPRSSRKPAPGTTRGLCIECGLRSRVSVTQDAGLWRPLLIVLVKVVSVHCWGI